MPQRLKLHVNFIGIGKPSVWALQGGEYNPGKQGVHSGLSKQVGKLSEYHPASPQSLTAQHSSRELHYAAHSHAEVTVD